MADKFDIENFPKSKAAKRMMSRVSPIYEKSYVSKWLFEVMGLEMEEARILVEGLRDQCFIEHCTWGMRYWEQRYHINVDESVPIEDRRQYVLAKRTKFAPMTPARLEIAIKQVCGRSATVTEYNDQYRFDVKISGDGTAFDYKHVVEMIRIMKPSHLSVGIVEQTEKDLCTLTNVTCAMAEYHRYRINPANT